MVQLVNQLPQVARARLQYNLNASIFTHMKNNLTKRYYRCLHHKKMNMMDEKDEPFAPIW